MNISNPHIVGMKYRYDNGIVTSFPIFRKIPKLNPKAMFQQRRIRSKWQRRRPTLQDFFKELAKKSSTCGEDCMCMGWKDRYCQNLPSDAN